MLEMKWIRAHAEEVQAAADGKKIKINIRTLLERDEERRTLLQEIEEGRSCAIRYPRTLADSCKPGIGNRPRVCGLR